MTDARPDGELSGFLSNLRLHAGLAPSRGTFVASGAGTPSAPSRAAEHLLSTQAEGGDAPGGVSLALLVDTRRPGGAKFRVLACGCPAPKPLVPAPQERARAPFLDARTFAAAMDGCAARLAAVELVDAADGSGGYDTYGRYGRQFSRSLGETLANMDRAACVRERRRRADSVWVAVPPTGCAVEGGDALYATLCDALAAASLSPRNLSVLMLTGVTVGGVAGELRISLRAAPLDGGATALIGCPAAAPPWWPLPRRLPRLLEQASAAAAARRASDVTIEELDADDAGHDDDGDADLVAGGGGGGGGAAAASPAAPARRNKRLADDDPPLDATVAALAIGSPKKKQRHHHGGMMTEFESATAARRKRSRTIDWGASDTDPWVFAPTAFQDDMAATRKRSRNRRPAEDHRRSSFALGTSAAAVEPAAAPGGPASKFARRRSSRGWARPGKE